MLYAHEAELSDRLYDGVPLAPGFRATRWLEESTVHGALRITDQAVNTRGFVSLQSPIVRDEIRATTWVASNEVSGLFLTKVLNGAVNQRNQLTQNPVDRFSIGLRKYDGATFVAYTAGNSIFVNDRLIGALGEEPTFPSIALDQVPVGHYPSAPPAWGLLSYKTAGRLVLQLLTGDGEPDGAPMALPFEGTLGGLDVVIYDGIAVAKVGVVDGAGVTFHVARFPITDRIAESPAFEPVDLSGGGYSTFRPGGSPGFFDSAGRYHFSAVGMGPDSCAVYDVMPFEDLATEVGSHPSAILDTQASAFPKKPTRETAPLPFGFGDGVTDGSGIIVTTLQNGLLLASNSQSGGYSYPSDKILNHEMPEVLCFRSTECYTRGAVPNTVSMDYLFVEADSRGEPVDSSIWLETWDMPLPAPKLTASASNDRIRLRIEADGWFIPGTTSIQFSDPLVRARSIEWVDERELVVTTTAPPPSGTTAVFEAFSDLFYHRGEARIA